MFKILSQKEYTWEDLSDFNLPHDDLNETLRVDNNDIIPANFKGKIVITVTYIEEEENAD